MTAALQLDVASGLRPGEPADLPFMYATWLRALRHGSAMGRRVKPDDLNAFHHALIDRALSRAGTRLLIASEPGAPQVIYGYVCYEVWPEGAKLFSRPIPTRVLHFIFVKRAWRRFGVAHALLEAAEIDLPSCCFTALTTDMDALWSRFPSARHVPYLL